MNDITNQTIVITGASSGLGRAVAHRLADEKTKLILVGRNEDRLSKTANEIKEKGSEAKSYICDITSPKQVEETTAKILSDFKKVDILINNAGIWNSGHINEHTKEEVAQLFATNVEGLIYFTQEMLPQMKDSNSGQILNISSVAGVVPSGDWGIYTSTKYAVRGFTDSLKMEVADTKIKVLGFYPGGMDTNIFDNDPKKGDGKVQPWMMKKEDIAQIIAFMLLQPSDIVMDHVEVRKR